VKFYERFVWFGLEGLNCKRDVVVVTVRVGWERRERSVCFVKFRK
jgi:hypothetical protein